MTTRNFRFVPPWSRQAAGGGRAGGISNFSFNVEAELFAQEEIPGPDSNR
jgi:hypothetical protein